MTRMRIKFACWTCGCAALLLSAGAGCQSSNSSSSSDSGTVTTPTNRTSPSSPFPDAHTLQVRMIPQKTEMWCWAASGQMVMEFLGSTVSVEQCEQAKNRFGHSDCCDLPTPVGCINGGWPEFKKYGFESQHTSSSELTWDQIREQIGLKQQPIAFTWHWNQGGGHMMVIIGYKLDERSLPTLVVYDPYPPDVSGVARPAQDMLYTEYVSGSDYTHWDDYYDIHK